MRGRPERAHRAWRGDVVAKRYAADQAANEPFLAKTRAERGVFQKLVLKALQQSIALERFAHLD